MDDQSFLPLWADPPALSPTARVRLKAARARFERAAAHMPRAACTAVFADPTLRKFYADAMDRPNRRAVFRSSFSGIDLSCGVVFEALTAEQACGPLAPLMDGVRDCGTLLGPAAYRLGRVGGKLYPVEAPDFQWVMECASLLAADDPRGGGRQVRIYPPDQWYMRPWGEPDEGEFMTADERAEYLPPPLRVADPAFWEWDVPDLAAASAALCEVLLSASSLLQTDPDLTAPMLQNRAALILGLTERRVSTLAKGDPKGRVVADPPNGVRLRRSVLTDEQKARMK